MEHPRRHRYDREGTCPISRSSTEHAPGRVARQRSSCLRNPCESPLPQAREVDRAQTPPFARADDVRGLDFATSTRSGTSSASTCTSAGARSDIGHRTDGVAARRGYDREGTRSERGLDDMTKNLAIRVPNTPRGVLRLSVRAARAWFTSVAYSLNQQRAPERVQRPTSEWSTNTPRGVFKSCAAVPEGQRPFRAAAPAPPDPIPAPRHPAPRSRRHGFALPPPGSSPSARASPSSATASAGAA